ncbi:unnamed protein product, partial [Rotaria sp. Silwood2]
TIKTDNAYLIGNKLMKIIIDNLIKRDFNSKEKKKYFNFFCLGCHGCDTLLDVTSILSTT